MAMLYTDLVTLAANATFRGRVTIAIYNTCRRVGLGTLSVNSQQLRAAQEIVSNVPGWLDRVVNVVVNDPSVIALAVTTDGSIITDATLQALVDTALTALVK